jgi:hypothetical protein
VRFFKAVIERDVATGLYVGHVPGFTGAHSQGASVEELKDSLRDLADGRTITVPIAWYPRLLHATPAQRSN